MENIDQHIQKNQNLLNDPTISPQSRRHTQEELTALETYKENHPEDSHDPTSLELYCELNPNADECRIYEDWTSLTSVTRDSNAPFLCPIIYSSYQTKNTTCPTLLSSAVTSVLIGPSPLRHLLLPEQQSATGSGICPPLVCLGLLWLRRLMMLGLLMSFTLFFLLNAPSLRINWATSMLISMLNHSNLFDYDWLHYGNGTLVVRWV